MSYKAIVTRLSNVRPHSNADKVQLATCHGNQVVIGLDSKESHWGVYFPCDGQLSHEFCHANNLYRDSKLNKYPNEKGGMFDVNRRVRAQKFRGEISDGFWVPLHYFGFLSVTGLDVEGLEFDTWQGVPICNKYVNAATAKIARENQGKKTRVLKSSVMFKEHFDTGHFGRNIHEFKKGQHIVVTEKLHGTSHRIGYVQVQRSLKFWERIVKSLGIAVQETEWTYLNGTRRVVLDESKNPPFHEPTIRDKAALKFKGNLRKGETVYLEIVGFESTGAAIMPAGDTEKIGDWDFSEKYGPKMFYSYGCAPMQSDVYVYRMTFTNEDGQSVDYSWNDVVKRCSEIGVKTVPHITTFTLSELEANMPRGLDLQNYLSKTIEVMGSGPSILDQTHIKEGVCVRIEGGLENKTFKFKSFEFKVLEGIAKDSGVIDEEEAQG